MDAGQLRPAPLLQCQAPARPRERASTHTLAPREFHGVNPQYRIAVQREEPLGRARMEGLGVVQGAQLSLDGSRVRGLGADLDQLLPSVRVARKGVHLVALGRPDVGHLATPTLQFH